MTISRRSVFAYMREFLLNPRNVGSFAESGIALSSAMAKSINAEQGGIIVEFGPGTGVITTQLLANGVEPSQLMLVEFNPTFAVNLRARFPQLKIVEGDAWEIEALMRRNFPDQYCATIISGLPLLNFSNERRDILMQAIAKVLEPQHGRFVQFSYGLKMPIKPDDGFTVSCSRWILKNIPPARVWIYSRHAPSYN